MKSMEFDKNLDQTVRMKMDIEDDDDTNQLAMTIRKTVAQKMNKTQKLDDGSNFDMSINNDSEASGKFQ